MLWRAVRPDLAPARLTTFLSAVPLLDLIQITQVLASGPFVLFAPEAFDAVHAHVRVHREESGGLLLGYAAIPAEAAEAMPYPVVVVTHAVPSSDFSGTSVSLRMRPSVWTDALSGKPEGTLVVGWFHSHPNLGAFFSGTDRKTQRDFFAHQYSVGYVIDHLRDKKAFFLGADSVQIDPSRIYARRLNSRLLAALREPNREDHGDQST
jgi:proteasome lid subunit RPN8/RPN11